MNRIASRPLGYVGEYVDQTTCFEFPTAIYEVLSSEPLLDKAAFKNSSYFLGEITLDNGGK